MELLHQPEPAVDVEHPDHLEVHLVPGLELEGLHEQECQVFEDHLLGLGEDVLRRTMRQQGHL